MRVFHSVPAVAFSQAAEILLMSFVVSNFTHSSGECMPLSACCDFFPDHRDSSDELCSKVKR